MNGITQETYDRLGLGTISLARANTLYRSFRFTASGYHLGGENERIRLAYVRAVDAFLGVNLRGGEDADQIDVTFFSGSISARVTNKALGESTTLDCLPLKIEELTAYWEAVSADKVAMGTFAPYSVGNLSGEVPYVRETSRNRQISRDPVELAAKEMLTLPPGERRLFAKRFHFARVLGERLLHLTQNQKRAAEAEYRDALVHPAQQAQAIGLKKKIEHLSSLEQELHHFDLYPIAVALRHMPEDPVDPLFIQNQLEPAMKEEMERELTPESNWTHKLPMRKPPEIDVKDREFIGGALSLLHHDRLSQIDYWERGHSRAKREMLAHLLVREATRYARDPGGYTEEMLVESVLTKGKEGELADALAPLVILTKATLDELDETGRYEAAHEVPEGLEGKALHEWREARLAELRADLTASWG